MGRKRNMSGEDGMTIRVLELCGKILPPLGLAVCHLDSPSINDFPIVRDELIRRLNAEGFDIKEYRRIRAEKALYHDDSIT